MFQAIKARYIITPDQSFLTNSAVIINNNIISGIVPNYQLARKKYKIIDLKNSVLLPGFINSHVHLELHWTQKLLNPFNSFPNWLNQIISLKKNFDNSKISNSVKKGLEVASGEYILFQDADLEYDPADYEKFYKLILENSPDIVIGSRFQGSEFTKVMYFWNKIGNRVLTFIFNILFKLLSIVIKQLNE